MATEWEWMQPRERDAWIAENVMGWERVTEDAEQPDAVPYLVSPEYEPGFSVYYPSVAAKFPLSYPPVGLKPYSTDAAADYLVLAKVRQKWATSAHVRFTKKLECDVWWERIGTHGTGDPNFSLWYEPGDYSHAAYLAMQERT